MDSLAITKYREVPLLKQSIELNRKTIDVTCGGYPTMLVDSKTFELSGGFVFDGTYAGRQHGARFIYWHTLRETIYFTETCLHRNDFWHEVKITFKGTPILSVGIHGHGSKNFFILIATTTSFHRIPIKRPSSADGNLIVEQDSVLSKLNEHIITDPMNCYTFINDIGQSPPMAASAMHCSGRSYSTFAIATGKSLHLCTMGLGGDKPEVKFVNLECHTSLTDHMGSGWISNRTHSAEVVTMCFIPTSAPDDQSLLFTLHRDGALRVWQPSGQLLTADYLYKYTKGSKADFHSCVSRGSKMLIGLFVSFKTFSEFVILRPTVTFDRQGGSISSLALQNVCSINAPKLDLIDFQLCDLSLWSLWCNSTNEMQTLVHEMAPQAKLGTTNWQPVVMTSALDDDLPENADGIDLREFYCKRIFNSGLFQLVTIKKTCMMLKDNVTGREGSPFIGSMSRLKRDVSACIKAQLKKEQAIMERNGPCDNEQLLELSNQLWEKFYRYCVQQSNKSSRPIGLFLCEELVNETRHLSVGLVRKQFVSFFRTCDRLEAAYYSDEPQAVGETAEMSDATLLLVKFLKVTEESLTPEHKQELDNFVYQQQIVATEPRLDIDLAADFEMDDESETGTIADSDDLAAVHTDDISLLSVAITIAHSQNNFIAFEVMRNFGANKIDLVSAICSLLRFVTPDKRNSEPAAEKGHEGYVSVHTGHHLYSELALATTKQTIELRYMLLRNLLLLQYLIRSLQSELRNETINKLLIRLQPRIEMLVRCYHVMNWMASSRLELDWSRKRRTEIIATFPPNQRNTPLTLLQAYSRCRLNYKPPRQLWPSTSTLDDPLDDIGDSYALSLTQKANVIIAHLSPFHDDFRFGEWLSENELSVHIDDYVELVGKWCAANKNSRTFIRAKSCLLDGDTFKALDLFLKAQEGVHKERFLLMFLRYYPNGEQRSLSPYEISSTYFLQVIRLFELYGAHDAVPKLVTVALKHTLHPGQQAMFQNIEFSSHMALGRYEKAYKALSSNVDPARRKDCLRQMVSLLLSTQRLDMLMKLPSRGQLLEFTEIVAMNARSADNEDMFRYYFLYAFYADRLFMRDAADIAFEEAMRYITDNTTRDQLQRYCDALLRCISCLATVPTWRAWVARPAISQGQNNTEENKLEVLDLKKLQERLTIGHSVLSLCKNTDDTKLLTSLKPKELVQLLMRRKKYNLALQLAHCSVPSMVPTVYGNLAKSCVFVSSSQSDASSSIDTDDLEAGSNGETGLAWLHENCLSDVPVGVDSASTAWNYLRYMISSEPDELIIDAYLAVLGSVIACGAHVPLWLRAWCFEHCPVQLVRAYWSHGFLEEAYECMVELFKIRLFTPGRFTHHAAFPLTLYERIFYDLEQSPNYNKATLEKYLSLIEINVRT